LEQNQNFLMCSNFFFAKAKRFYFFSKNFGTKPKLFLGTLVGKRKQTIFKKRWFDITIRET
jgi:hypothetical protein